MSTDTDTIPAGLTLRHTLRGHSEEIYHIAWSPDGQVLASSSGDGDRTIRLWDTQTGQTQSTLENHDSPVDCVAWSPDGQILASSSYGTICLWDTQTRQTLRTLTSRHWRVWSVAWSPDGRMLASGGGPDVWDIQTEQPKSTLKGHVKEVCDIAWSPDGQVLASGSDDRTVRLWDTQTKQTLHILTGHTQEVKSVAWSPDGQILASSSGDRTIRLWNPLSGRQIRLLEGHTAIIHSLSFSADGLLLASKSRDDTVRLWRTDTWETVAILPEPSSTRWTPVLAFHPNVPVLATLSEKGTVIRIWDLDYTTLLGTTPVTSSVHYTNAKVVLVGESGVGKSGLGLVLTGKPFVPTESTHGRHVWTLSNDEIEGERKRKQIQETLLWDLAGQHVYHLIHQLHLHDATIALLVFDANRETDPLAGVRHWERALRQAARTRGEQATPLKTFLVAARTDRGGRSISRERINALLQELGFAGYFETSAKEGRNIRELREAIRTAIDWDKLPTVTSPEIFQRIKAFLLQEKEAGRMLPTQEELYLRFLQAEKLGTPPTELHAQFTTCLGRMEASGLVRSLSFGNLVLLQPEALDAYASALLIAAKDEPDSLGSIAEDKVRQGIFAISQEERLADKGQEKLLLLAMIEELLRHEIALREQGELIFPSQTIREYPNAATLEGKTISFTFEGPLSSIYTILVVRLSLSGFFQKRDFWKDAATYSSRLGGAYGLFMKRLSEERAELTLFFDQVAREELRFHFESFVQEHLQSHALPESIVRRRLFVCSHCGEPFSERQVQNRRDRHLDWIQCSNCDTRVSLRDGIERLTATPAPTQVEAMNEQANRERDRQASLSVIEGKQAAGDFDVFLCHRVIDKAAVKQIGEQLKERSILPWLDEWELRPGLPWQRVLEQQIGHIKAAAVFIGKQNVGHWQQEELEALLGEFMKRGCPVIPVLLPDAPPEPKIPLFLNNRTWVDFRKTDPDPLKQLIWGITGNQIHAL